MVRQLSRQSVSQSVSWSVLLFCDCDSFYSLHFVVVLCFFVVVAFVAAVVVAVAVAVLIAALDALPCGCFFVAQR